MNKQPISYMQTDPRWSKLPYQVPGETATIGGSGCGPTCAAMLIETLKGQTYTPEDACNWSMAHGYKAPNQGTYYSYFPPQFKAFGIDCQQLNSVSLYGNPASAIHDRAFELLKCGYYLIACMGKGLWTSSGHFIVAWWEDGRVRINDPASTLQERLNGDLWTFKSQVKYYWAIDARKFNKEDDTVTYEQWKAYMEQYRKELQEKEESQWSKDEGGWQWGKDNGVVDGTKPCDFVTREQLAAVEFRLHGK